MKYLFLPLGALFGFLLSRGGATTYDYYAKLFLFQDLQLMWVILGAVLVGAPGIALMKWAKARSLVGRDIISFEPKPMQRGLLPGALMLGVGWGMSAACPGTVLAMLGEGKLSAVFVISGILLGTWIYGRAADASLPRQLTATRD
jgi:hypothetical protein